MKSPLKENLEIFFGFVFRFSRKGKWNNLAITTDDNQMSCWCVDDPGKMFDRIGFFSVVWLQTIKLKHEKD